MYCQYNIKYISSSSHKNAFWWKQCCEKNVSSTKYVVSCLEPGSAWRILVSEGVIVAQILCYKHNHWMLFFFNEPTVAFPSQVIKLKAAEMLLDRQALQHDLSMTLIDASCWTYWDQLNRAGLIHLFDSETHSTLGKSKELGIDLVHYWLEHAGVGVFPVKGPGINCSVVQSRRCGFVSAAIGKKTQAPEVTRTLVWHVQCNIFQKANVLWIKSWK